MQKNERGIFMKAKMIKILLLIFIFILLFNSYKVYANDYKIQQVSEETEQALEQFRPTSNPADSETAFKNQVSKLLGYINIIGTVIAVIAVVAIGIRYMLGSVEERAEYKKTVITYLIGAFLLFAVTTLPNILYKIGQAI